MGIIGRREFKLIMSLDDQTRRERESINRGLGDVQRTAKKAQEEAKGSIIEMAKASKQGMEGIKAVLELGGWLMMAQQIGKAFMDITAEARKNSAAFRDAGAALSVVKSEIGESLVKALEPLAEGFSTVLKYGTAIFRHFPEIAKETFKYIEDIITATFSWEGLKTIFLSLGEGIISIFRSAFEHIPKLFVAMIKLLISPISSLGEYLGDTLKKALSGEWKQIESPGAFIARSLKENVANLKGAGTEALDYIKAQAGNVVAAASNIGTLYADAKSKYDKATMSIIAPDLADFDNQLRLKRDAGIPDSESVQGGYRQATWNDVAISRAFANGMKDGIRNVDWATVALNRRVSEPAWMDSARNVTSGLKNTEAVAGFGSAGPLGAVFASVSKFLPTLTNLMNILNPLQTILDAAMGVLGPIINDLLAPLSGALKVLGYALGHILGPALQILEPIIKFVAELFVWVYNTIIVPVGNLVIGIFNFLYNAIAGFINGVIYLVDQIPFVDMQGKYITYRDLTAGQLAAIDTSTLATAASSSGSGSSGGGSASYAAGTSITIEKIEIKADFIAGDAGMMDVAVKIRDLIREADRIGR